MPVRIYDIAKELGLKNPEILAKAKALGITAAKVASSSLDKITAEFLKEELLKEHPDIAAKFATPAVAEPPKPPPVEEKIVVITAPPPEVQVAPPQPEVAVATLEVEPPVDNGQEAAPVPAEAAVAEPPPAPPKPTPPPR